jgi:hypothetical protein
MHTIHAELINDGLTASEVCMWLRTEQGYVNGELFVALQCRGPTIEYELLWPKGDDLSTTYFSYPVALVL